VLFLALKAEGNAPIAAKKLKCKYPISKRTVYLPGRWFFYFNNRDWGYVLIVWELFIVSEMQYENS
jgi:hypothetical protein